MAYLSYLCIQQNDKAMNLETIILVEDGDVFDGTREQFMDCFFSNASDYQIQDWCESYEWSLSINGEEILKKGIKIKL